jgi:hypothetical protein
VKPAVWGAVAGAVALTVVGFSQLGWTLGSTAEKMATQRAETAVVAALAPICVEKFQQMGSEAVAQRVRRYPFGQRRQFGSHVADAIELARRHWADAVAPGEQPYRRAGDAPPVAQQLQQLRRQQGKAIPRLREGRLLRPLPCSTRSIMRLE